MPEWKYANYPTHNRAYDYFREHSYILPGLCKMDIRGEDTIINIDQPFIAAFYPHTSHFDAYAVYHELLNLGVGKIIVAAAADYWFSNPLINTFGSSVMPIFPQPRPGKNATDRSAGKALLHLAQRVRDGDSLIWAPEGTRDGNGKLNPGIAGLARKSGKPVVPVVLHGLENSWLKGHSLPNLNALVGHTITICFCPPIGWLDCPDEKTFLERLKRTYVETYEELKQNGQ